MASKKKIVKELDRFSKKFLEPEKRKRVLSSLKGDKTKWFLWVSQIKGVLKNLDKIDAAKFSGLILLLEQNPKSRFHQDNLKRFLISKTEFYRHYDFSLEKKLAEEERTRGNLWISKILRLFISRSFLGILILVLIIGFVAWFYIDRQGCLEFVRNIIGPFLKAIK